MNKYNEAIEVIDTLLHLMCGEEREDGYKPTMEEMSKSMDLLTDLANKADSKHEEMTASEMFERLGFKRTVESEKIRYTKAIKGTFNCFEIMFDLSEKDIVLDDGYEAYTINNDLLKAIDKQAEELGWLYEKTCTNESEYDLIDEFECSNCGIILSEYQQIEVDEDDGERFFYDYRPKYCPNCGRKIVEENEDER